MLEKSLELLASVGIHFSENVATSRKLIFDADDAMQEEFTYVGGMNEQHLPLITR